MTTEACRILHVQPVSERGGSDQALLRLVSALPGPEYESHVVFPGPTPLREEFRSAGARLHTVRMRRISTSHDLLGWVSYALAWPVAVLRLACLARRLDIDVVHTNSLHSWYGWAVAFLLRLPHVWHAREIVVQSRAALRLERFLARRFAATVIAISHAVAAQLDPRNVLVVTDEPDPRRFNPQATGLFRSEHGIDDDAPLIGFVGRLDTWKGVETLLDAIPFVRERVAGTTVALVGGSVPGKEAYADELARRAADIGAVCLAGEVADAAAAIADLDVLVLPSTEPEPYGLVVVEALACGVPAVVTTGGGAEEIARECTQVLVVPPSDATALAHACLELLGPHPVTSTALRRERPVLRAPRDVDHTTVFSAVCRRRRGELPTQVLRLRK